MPKLQGVLVTFYYYELTHFWDWMKNTLLFICSTNILVRLLTVNMKNSLTPKNQKMFDSILVTLLKMQPHYSQSSLENATPSSGTFPLAPYKAVPPPPQVKSSIFLGEMVAYQTIVLCGHVTSELSVTTMTTKTGK